MATFSNAQRLITADYNHVKGPLNTFFKECIGAGRANEGLRADWQKQLAFVKKECGFEYIRMHGLLHDDMGIVYKEDKNGNAIYNWNYIDLLYDYLLSIGMKPFVELSFMPSALASNKQTVFWWKGNISYPKNETAWYKLINELVKHLTQRYGKQEVAKWYFEVWNEPNLKDLFFAGTMQDYFKLYALTAKAVKDADAGYKVGGPATAGSGWITEFIDYCSTNKVPVDFVATHTYGVKNGFVDLDGQRGHIIDNKYSSLYSEVISTKNKITQSALPALPLHYTEWSSSYSSRDPIHDSYHQCAYILDKLKNTGDAVNSMSYWVFTDIFEENGPGATPFHGGFGLLNNDGITKPAFYAYQYLNKLGATELNNSDKASWVCKSASGNVQVLLWDFTITHPGDSVNNETYYKRDLPSKRKGHTSISLKNIPSGNYRLNIYKTGYGANDAYTAWYKMGSPIFPTPEQISTLKQENNGKPALSSVVHINDGIFKKDISINENDVYLIDLIKQ